MKNIYIILACMLVMPHANSRSLTDEERKAIEASIKETLKDPDSAKFFHGDFPYPDKTMLYCGYVNAKNSYGGYTGKVLFSNFVAKNNKGIIVAPSMDFSHSTGEAYSQEIISVSCASAGYDISIPKKYFKKINKDRREHNIPLLGAEYIQN